MGEERAISRGRRAIPARVVTRQTNHTLVSRVIAPKDVHVFIILMPGTHEYITLYGKRDFADVIKLRFLKWGDYNGLLVYAQYNHRVLIKERQGREGQSQREI